MKSLVIIPAYNEEKSILNTVADIKKNAPDFDYIIINDCSQDKTLQLCKDAGIPVINLPINLGIGGAVQTGYLYAKKNHYDYAVQFDGDGQHERQRRDGRELRGRGREDLLHAGFRQFEADEKDHHRYAEPRDVLDARVAVRVLLIGGFCREAEAQKRHNAGRRVGEVVQAVGHDGDAARHKARQKFGTAQKQVADDAHRTREVAVRSAHTRVGHVIFISDEQSDE